MPEAATALRQQLARALGWGEARLTLEDAARRVPTAARGRRPRGHAHSPWELLEHIRLAQRDLLEFATRSDYAEKEWPKDYWPPSPKPPRPGAWAASLKTIAEDRAALKTLVETAPLLADVPSAPGKSVLRAVLLVLDHTSYHTGQLVLAAKLLGR